MKKYAFLIAFFVILIVLFKSFFWGIVLLISSIIGYNKYQSKFGKQRQIEHPSPSQNKTKSGTLYISKSKSHKKTQPPQENTPIAFQWIPIDQVVNILGHNISGGFYAASSVDDHLSEPSTITLNDPIGSPVEPHIFTSSYYPSYTKIQPNEKSSYLKWLAEGLNDHDPDDRAAGYIFIYFYGLERRVLIDGDLDPRILNLVHTLLTKYGQNSTRGSIRSYLGEFLHFNAYQLGHDQYRSLWPTYITSHESKVTETTLSLILANLKQRSENLDSSIAYHIAKLHDDSKRSVVIQRSGELFRQLFKRKYDETYPNGLELKSGKRNKVVRYHSANGTINPRYNQAQRFSNEFQLSVPNIYALRGQFKKLPQIWNECIDELSGYSKALLSLSENNNPSIALKLKTYLALPESMRNQSEHPIRKDYAAIAEVSEKSEDSLIIRCSTLAEMIGIETRTTLTKNQSIQIADLISSLDLSCAPNPLHIGLPLRWNQDLVISPKCNQPTEQSPNLRGALKLLYLTVIVSAADGSVDEAEMQLFNGSVEILNFTNLQKEIISLTTKALLRDTNLAVKNLTKISKSIPENDRIQVFKHLVSVAAVDEIITSDEKRILIRIQKAMDLSNSSLDSILTEINRFKTVQVSNGRAEKGGEVIPPPQKADEESSFSLDMSKIKDITAETQSVVALLAEVLNEDSDEPTEEPLIADANDDWLSELEPIYRKPLLQLLQHASPTIADIKDISQHNHIMHTSLIDTVNDWSDEALGDFLIEITDNNVNIYRYLIPA